MTNKKIINFPHIIDDVKHFFIKENELREKIEDAMANTLQTLEANTSLQDTEKALVLSGLKAGMAYLQTQTGEPFTPTDEQYNQIVTNIMSVKAKLMVQFEKQLRKK